MNLDFDSLIMLGAVSAGVYMAGYTGIGVGLFAVSFLFTFIGGGFKKKLTAKEKVVQGLRVQGADVLEPIVIKTTRDAPFRIPDRMDMRIKPTWGSPRWFEKASWGLNYLANPLVEGFRGRIKNV